MIQARCYGAGMKNLRLTICNFRDSKFVIMTSLGAILHAAIARVQAADPDEARLKCEWLTSRVLGCPRLELAARKKQSLSQFQIRLIEKGAARLA